MKKLTEEQFNDVYGESEVVFAHYYKYSFLFVGELEGKSINIMVGGNSDDIYRFDVEPNKKYKVKELGFNYATVKDGDETIVEVSCWW
jgi:hypothetical protein